MENIRRQEVLNEVQVLPPMIKISKTKVETKVLSTEERDKDFDRIASTSPSIRCTSTEDKRAI